MDNLYRDLLFGKISYKDYLEKTGFNYTRPQIVTDKNILDSWEQDEDFESYVPIIDYSNIENYRKARLGEISEYDFYTLWEQGANRRHRNAPIISEIDYKDEIYSNAISLEASDITIYKYENQARVMYNVRGEWQDSKLKIPLYLFDNIVTVLTGDDVSTFSWQIGQKDGHYKINNDWIGRYNIEKLNEKDLHVTIRLAQTGKFNKRLEDLGLSKDVEEFLRNDFTNLYDKNGLAVGGLRLICGKPSSGKNWTMLAALRLLTEKGYYKGVNIGSPIETVIPGLIPVDCPTEKHASKAVQALNRQAASFAYNTEITETNVIPSVVAANKGVPMFGTIHCNTAADVILRIMLITNFTADIVIQSLHSVLHQGLVKDESRPLGRRPVCTYIMIDDELRSKCFGKSTGEIYNILKENTKGDI